MEQLPTVDRLAAAGGDRTAADVVQRGALQTRQGQRVAAAVIVGQRIGGDVLDRADAGVDIADLRLHRPHTLVGGVELTAGHRIGAACSDAAGTDVDDTARGRTIRAVAATDRHHIGFDRARTGTQRHRVGTGDTCR
ncbi:hypothetical protein D3C71_1726140 [compost metagenome]